MKWRKKAKPFSDTEPDAESVGLRLLTSPSIAPTLEPPVMEAPEVAVEVDLPAVPISVDDEEPDSVFTDPAYGPANVVTGQEPDTDLEHIEVALLDEPEPAESVEPEPAESVEPEPVEPLALVLQEPEPVLCDSRGGVLVLDQIVSQLSEMAYSSIDLRSVVGQDTGELELAMILLPSLAEQIRLLEDRAAELMCLAIDAGMSRRMAANLYGTNVGTVTEMVRMNAMRELLDNLTAA